jgi:L-amino acid N-acyltransferase YncA
MRFMVIERFRGGDPAPVGERFRREGRMLPDGVTYEASWIDPAGTRCFQLMEAPSRDALDAWMARWSDLVDFEAGEVVDPAVFWANRAPADPSPQHRAQADDLEIRAAKADDAEAVARIYAPIVESTPDSFELVAPDAAEMRRRIAATSASHAWLVASLQGEVAGYAYGTAHRARPAYRTSVEVSVFVAPAAQRRGIARRLYDALLRELAARGYHRAFAGITASNESSVAFHRSVGFTPVGVFHEIGFKFGRWHDTSWWERDLAPVAPARYGLP